MKELINKLKIFIYNEKIILILFGIYVATTNLDYSVLGFYHPYTIVAKSIRYMIYIIAFIKIILKIIDTKKINLATCIMVVFFISIMIVSKNKLLLTLLITILLVQDINFKKLVQYCLYSNLLIYLILILGSIFEVIPNWTFLRGNEIRYSCGYCYPTLTSTYFFLLILMRFYLKNGKIEICDFSLQLLGAVIVYKVTDSRMGFALALVIIVAELIIKICKVLKLRNDDLKLTKMGKKFFTVLPIIVIAILSLITITYINKNDFAIGINKIMSNRLQLSSEAIEDYGMPLLGKNIKWYGWGGHGYVEQENFKYNFVDIAYFKIIFDNGLIFLVLYIISYTLYMKKIAADNELLIIFVNSIILIWGMIEPNILEIGKNPFIIPMVMYIISQGKNVDISSWKIISKKV